MNPATFLRVLGPERWRVCYVEPSVRPDDSRYGENPNRLQQHTQFQVRRAGPLPGLQTECTVVPLICELCAGDSLQLREAHFWIDHCARACALKSSGGPPGAEGLCNMQLAGLARAVSQSHGRVQVILKPDPGNPQELYLGSLEALGIDTRAHDVRPSSSRHSRTAAPPSAQLMRSLC